MQVDVQSLGTFNQLAREGAREATRAMAQMTGIETSVDVTRISLVDRADVGEELGSREFAGVEFAFEGGLRGRTVLVFEREKADEIAAALLSATGDEEMVRSSVEEIGNIMMSGFIDGWADHLGTTIEQTPPTYIERSGADVLPDGPETAALDQVFVFRSEMDWAGDGAGFYIYMLPEYESLAATMSAQSGTDDAIPVEKLAVFNRMTRRGTEKAADNVEMLSGIPTAAKVSQISFTPVEDIPKQVGTDTYVGTVVEFTGCPSGFLLVLFDETSAETIAEALMPVDGAGEGLTDQHRSAIQELGNIMTSGFIDGWANVLEQSIDHAPPRLVHDMGQAILDPLAAQLGQHQRHAFVVDSKMQTDGLAFESDVYVLPDEAELREALENLSVERADQTEADVEKIFRS